MKLLAALLITIPLAAQTPAALEECRGLKHHGKLAEAQTCYAKLAESSNPYLRAEGLWGIERYDDANNQFRDLIRRGIEREVTSVENVDPSARHISPIRLRLRQLEREIVFAPDYQQPRLSFVHPRLPRWICLDVRAVIVEEVALNVGLHGSIKKSEFVSPKIGVIALHIRIVPNVPRARGLQR